MRAYVGIVPIMSTFSSAQQEKMAPAYITGYASVVDLLRPE